MAAETDLRSEDRATRMAKVLELSLVEGLGIRAIARQTRLNPKTVRKLLGCAKTEAARRAPAAPRPSLLDAHTPLLRKMLEEAPDLRAPAALDRLRPLGYQGGVSILRDRLRALRPRPAREAFLTRSYEPGRMLQVDWANFGFAIPGCARRVSAFVAGLAFSRLLFITFTLSQAMGSFLRCMDLALRFFGGRTQVDVFDNMKTVVLRRVGRLVIFNPRFVEYAQARGIGITACTPARPTEKPYAERPIGFVRTRFWPGRHFADLLDLNRQAVHWRDDIANNRIHDDTGLVPSLVYEHQEKALLQPLLLTPFDTDDLFSTTISKTFRVTFDRNDYSVPWRLHGQAVVVRANDDQLTVHLGRKPVALHRRCWDVGQQICDDSHERGLLEEKARGASGSLPPELHGLGVPAEAYFKILAANSRSLRREIQSLVLFSELYGTAHLRDAIGEVMATGHVGAEYVEYVLRHKKGLQPGPALLKLGDAALDDIHLAEPDLSVYPRPRKMLDPGDAPKPLESPEPTQGSCK